jgi:hypothetical protein
MLVQVSGEERAASSGRPLVERASRAAQPVAAPEQGAAWLTIQAAPEPAQPLERDQTAALPPGGPYPGPVHPPVSIGEIHVHVTEPAVSGADPLALLTPYARGLTARRGGVT